MLVKLKESETLIARTLIQNCLSWNANKLMEIGTWTWKDDILGCVTGIGVEVCVWVKRTLSFDKKVKIHYNNYFQ